MFNRRLVLASTTALAASLAMQSRAEIPAGSVTGKTVLITGCSSGFGRLTALHLARQGARVMASMRNLDGGKRPEAVALKAIADKEGLDLIVPELDVLDSASVDAAARQTHEHFSGQLDVLINNAGIGLGGPVEMHDLAATRLQFDTNVTGPLMVARSVLPMMRAKGRGHIIQVTSQLGRMVIPTIGMYCATKHAAEAMFESLAYELVPSGVKVTIVQPGGYPTKIWENGGRYFEALSQRTSASLKAAYGPHLEMTRALFGPRGRTTDPMDVALAMERIIALPDNQKPLRQPVHPNTAALDALNGAHAKVQARMLSSGLRGQWHDAVTGKA